MGVGKVGEIDVVAAKSLPAVGEEIEGATVGSKKGGFFVAGGINGSAEIVGATPIAVGKAVGTPNINTAVATFAVRGEVEGLPVGRDRGLGFPRGGRVDLWPKRFGMAPAFGGAMHAIEVAVGVCTRGGDDREIELGAIGGEAYSSFGVATIERGREGCAERECRVYPRTATEHPTRFLKFASIVGAATANGLAAEVVAFGAVEGEVGQCLIIVGVEDWQWMGGEGYGVEFGFGKETRPMEVVGGFFVEGGGRLGRGEVSGGDGRGGGGVIDEAKVLVEFHNGRVVVGVGVVDNGHIVVGKGGWEVGAKGNAAREIAANGRDVESIGHGIHTEPQLGGGCRGVAFGHAAHLLRGRFVLVFLVEGDRLAVGGKVGR